METNENSFTLKMATDGPIETQASFPNTEAMDTTPVDNAVTMNNDEGIKKMAEPVEVIENQNEEMSNTMNEVAENEHAVNNKEEMNCAGEQEPIQSDPITLSPVKSQLNNSESLLNVSEEKVDGVTISVMVKEETDSGQPHDEQLDESEEMEQDNKEEETVEEPPEPDSNAAANDADNGETEVQNDVQLSEDETKVEEVSASEEAQQDDKVEESTAEPVVEEPQDAEMKEEEDGHVEEDDKAESDSKQQVEISDVTDKEEPETVEEDKKTDEELLIDHINTAYQCLDDFMNTKDEIKIKDCMDLLTEIKTLTVKTVDTLKAFTPEQKVKGGHSSKKGKKSKGSTKVAKGSTRPEKNDVGHESDSPDPFEEVNLKDIKGLAVFAKWPNSGWFYPGVVRDLALADLKGNQNLTVTFYDGLERDMKSINIFPAELIPVSSVLFDLDEETDLNVVSIEREDNWIKYVLNLGGAGEQFTKDFDKMAIKGAHMKTIKQTVDSQASKSENIVTGRRARGKSSMFNEDYVSSTSPRSTEKRKSKVEDSKSTPVKAPAKRKSSSKEEDSGESTPTKSASKRRQVNGTKSLPRRAAKK